MTFSKLIFFFKGSLGKEPSKALFRVFLMLDVKKDKLFLIQRTIHWSLALLGFGPPVLSVWFRININHYTKNTPFVQSFFEFFLFFYSKWTRYALRCSVHGKTLWIFCKTSIEYLQSIFFGPSKGNLHHTLLLFQKF